MISVHEQIPFEKLVVEIINGKNKKEDTTVLEHKIDLMVYKLYNLSYEEVLIVDPAFNALMTEETYEASKVV